MQLAAGVSVDPEQVAAAQPVPEAYFWHAPLPSQKPFVPHVAAPVSVHWLVGLGFWPPGMDVQIPRVPLRLHDVHVPRQALLQQTLLTQNPEAQEGAIVQAAPSDSFPQLPVVVLHVVGAVQSVLAVQVVLQAALVPQAKGSHRVEVTVLQLPAPSQVRVGVSVSPVHVAAAQVVVVL